MYVCMYVCVYIYIYIYICIPGPLHPRGAPLREDEAADDRDPGVLHNEADPLGHQVYLSISPSISLSLSLSLSLFLSIYLFIHLSIYLDISIYLICTHIYIYIYYSAVQAEAFRGDKWARARATCGKYYYYIWLLLWLLLLLVVVLMLSLLLLTSAITSITTITTRFYILQRGVQWKQGVVVYVVLCTILLCNTTPIHCTPLPLHSPLPSIQ